MAAPPLIFPPGIIVYSGNGTSSLLAVFDDSFSNSSKISTYNNYLSGNVFTPF